MIPLHPLSFGRFRAVIGADSQSSVSPAKAIIGSPVKLLYVLAYTFLFCPEEGQAPARRRRWVSA